MEDCNKRKRRYLYASCGTSGGIISEQTLPGRAHHFSEYCEPRHTLRTIAGGGKFFLFASFNVNGGLWWLQPHGCGVRSHWAQNAGTKAVSTGLKIVESWKIQLVNTEGFAEGGGCNQWLRLNRFLPRIHSLLLFKHQQQGKQFLCCVQYGSKLLYKY